MNMVTPIIDEKEVKRIASHLGYEKYHPPPPLQTPILEISYDDLAYA